MTQTKAPRDPALVQFGAEVKAARVRAGKKATQFAAEVEISRSRLYAIEAGEPASDAYYWRIANALSIDPSAVVREREAS
jgi:transcriptional regulator with XRE-family HTH domain